MSVRAERVAALVVGLERYAGGPFWDLNGPARDALHFCEWLLRRNVPPSNVHLFLSPLDKNQDCRAPNGVNAHGGTRSEIETAIIHWLRASPPEYFCLFWGGHGVMRVDGTRYVICSDARDHAVSALCLNDLLIYLRSAHVGGSDPSRLRRVVTIADVCAPYLELVGVDTALMCSTWGDKSPPIKQREQCTLLSARAGEFARNLTGQSTGLFSRELLTELEKETGLDCLFEDPGPMADRLVRRFEGLRQSGEATQGPSYWAFRDWNDERVVESGPCDLATLDVASPTYAVKRAEIAELCEAMGQLTTPLADAVVGAAFGRVQRSSKLPDQLTGQPYLWWCLDVLGKRLDRGRALFEFLCRCLPHIEDTVVATRVEEWQTRVAARTRPDLSSSSDPTWRDAPERMAPAGLQVIQVVVEPLPGSVLGRDGYALHIGLRSDESSMYDDDDTWQQPAADHAERPLDGDSLRQRFRDLYPAIFSRVRSIEEFRIEAVLPRELLAYGVEDWRVKRGTRVVPIADFLPVALRSYERRYNPDYHYFRAAASDRWHAAPAQLSWEHVEWVDSADPRTTASQLERAIALCAVNVRASGSNSQVPATIEALVESPVPLAIWLGGHEGQSSATRNAIADTFFTHRCGEWPKRALELRRTPADQRAVRCESVALFCEDPSVRLPDLQSRATRPLRAPEVEERHGD